eukprot:2621432-Pyramimonas_sp.AAC.1
MDASTPAALRVRKRCIAEHSARYASLPVAEKARLGRAAEAEKHRRVQERDQLAATLEADLGELVRKRREADLEPPCDGPAI